MKLCEVEQPVYVDALGIPQPVATISHFGGSYGHGGYWSLCTTAKNLPHYRWDDSEQAEIDMAAEGWHVIKRSRDGHGAIDLTIEHPPTTRMKNAIAKADEQKWKDAKPCFVRYGKLPPGGKSRNHADGTWEPGVSVFRGEKLPNGEARPLPSYSQELGSMLSLMASNQPLYIVSGDIVGTGSDGEPALANCKIVRRAK